MPEADFVNAAGKPMLQQSFTDTLINVDVLLPKGDGDALAKVMRRSVDANGKVIGIFNENPLLNTILYECEFEDGLMKEYTANMIASNIYEESNADYGATVQAIMTCFRGGILLKKIFFYGTGLRRNS